MKELYAALFLEQNDEFLFPNEKYTQIAIEDALAEASDSLDTLISSVPFKSPSTVQMISVLLGVLGVDRFYLGDIGLGIAKYFTLGGFGLWWIADMISAKNRCRAYNCRKLIEAINDPSVVNKMQRTNQVIDTIVHDGGRAVVSSIKGVKKAAKDFQDDMYIN